MLYNVIILGDDHIVRDAAEGLSDIEFQAGARISKQIASRYTTDELYDESTPEDWRQLVESKIGFEEDVTNNIMKSMYSPLDKWDATFQVY